MSEENKHIYKPTGLMNKHTEEWVYQCSKCGEKIEREGTFSLMFSDCIKEGVCNGKPNS